MLLPAAPLSQPRQYNHMDFNSFVVGHKMHLSQREGYDVGTPIAVDSLLTLRDSASSPGDMNSPEDSYLKHLHRAWEYIRSHSGGAFPTRETAIELYLFEEGIKEPIVFNHSFDNSYHSRVEGEIQRFRRRQISQGRLYAGHTVNETLNQYAQVNRLGSALTEKIRSALPSSWKSFTR